MEDDPAGAATSVWAATAAELDSSGGHYLEDCGVAGISDDEALETGVRAYAQDPQRAEALWELSSASSLAEQRRMGAQPKNSW